VISWLKRALRFGDHASIWRAARPGKSPAGATWFASRFLRASSIVVRRWGPRWAAGRRILGHHIGAWILALLWIGLPSALLLRATLRLFH
jgi:hypothetical protein